MLTYYYPILDKYRIPVTAITLLTDPVKDFHPSRYGIREFVLDRAENEGNEQGVANKNLEFTSSLIRETSFSDEEIAHLVGVSLEFVNKSGGYRPLIASFKRTSPG